MSSTLAAPVTSKLTGRASRLTSASPSISTLNDRTGTSVVSSVASTLITCASLTSSSPSVILNSVLAAAAKVSNENVVAVTPGSSEITASCASIKRTEVKSSVHLSPASLLSRLFTPDTAT